MEKVQSAEYIARDKKNGGVKEHLEGKEGEMIRARAKRLGVITALFLASWIITGAESVLEAYPFSIALISAANTFYIPISLGFILGYIFSEMGSGYLFAHIAIFAVKFVMSYMPMPIADRELQVVENNDKQEAGLLDSGDRRIAKKGKLEKILALLGIQGDGKKSRDGGERIMLCVAFGGIGGFVAGLFDLILNNFSFYSLYGLLFLTFICPCLAYLFYGVAQKSEGVSELKKCVAVLSLMTVVIFSAGEMTVFGIMLKPMLAISFTLTVSHKRGAVAGCIAAILSGIIISPLYLPLFILISPLYCFLREFKMSVGVAAVCTAILLYCYYFGKTDGLVSMLTPMLLGVPVFIVVLKFLEFIIPKSSKINAAEDIYFTEAIIEKDKNMAVKEKIHALSDAFDSLSKTFYELSDVFHRPGSLRLRDITDESFICVCEGCRHFDVCHGADYSHILDANAKITAALHSRGVVERSDIGEDFASRCIRADKIIEKVNQLCAKYTEQMIKGQNTHAFASNYHDVHSVLLDAINTDDGEYQCDIDTGEKIFNYLVSQNFDVKGVVVCGKRRKRVTVRGVGLNEMTTGQRADELATAVSQLVGEKMSGPIFEVSNDGTDMIFNSKPRYSIICSHARRAAFEGLVPASDNDGKELIYPFDDTAAEKRDESCGDVTGAFITHNSYFYSVICDGMGSGRDAAYIAGISCDFAEKMLCAGNKADITLRMMNNFLRSENYEKGKECSVAIDLFEFDLMSGTAAFIKSGGMPTYILRGEKVYKVSSKTMPVGIIKSPDVKITKFDMQKGDIAVMLSDGCTHDNDDCKWLINLLLENKIEKGIDLIQRGEEIADNLRDNILRTSRKMLPDDKKPDDISVSVSIIV